MMFVYNEKRKTKDKMEEIERRVGLMPQLYDDWNCHENSLGESW